MLNVSGKVETHTQVLFYVFLALPVVLLLMIFVFYKKDSEHKYIPFLMMLTLTFSSIAIILAGGGMLEYHFSIFMVVAIMAYYEDIKIIIASTVIFAIYHIIGYFVFPKEAFGSEKYSIIKA
jgi:methyl-accepting chemotaxis protein